MEEVWKARRERVLGAMEAQELEQMIVSDPKSVWYLTGVDVEPLNGCSRCICARRAACCF